MRDILIINFRSWLTALVLLIIAALPAAAETGNCENFPQSAHWNKLTHESITSYVQRKHDGDWVPYIAKWEKQLQSMKDIHKRGGSAIFKSKGVSLSGEELLGYIAELEKRVAITRCLSEQQ
ncbi:MAG: hypothetical protein HQ504_09345 [Rhodospirillaceae bacterium]|nr:hypothetical protein [Rhodospirillaceae bacterium]